MEQPAAEPEGPPETLNQVSGKLSYPDGTPAASVPFMIESTCEVVFGVSDRSGNFSVKRLKLPARFRAVDESPLVHADGDGFSRHELALKVEERAPKARLTPIVIQGGPKLVAVVSWTQGADPEALTERAEILSVWPKKGSVLAFTTPRGTVELRRAGYKVSVVSPDANRYSVESEGKSGDEMRALLEERVAIAQKRLADAKRGAVRRNSGEECANERR